MQTIQGANLQAAYAARPGRRPGLALAVLAASQLMIVLDISIVNIALPHIQRALNFSTTSLSWVVNAYTLAFGGMQVSVGSGYVDKILSPMLLFGLGLGLLVVPLIILAVSNLEPYEAGAASSLLSVMQQVGGSLGLAILMTVFGAVSRSQATEETVSVRHLGRLHRRGRIRAGRAGVSAAAIRAHGTGDIHLSTIPGVSALTRSWSVPTSPEGPGTRSPQRTKGAQIMTGKPSFADWVTDHAITADSLDPRAPLDDLEPLGELIGDARVVGIGESAHYVREFYLLRHRLLRFLVERCDFSVYAPEAPFTQARAIDAWIQGGPGTVEEVAAAGVAIDLGRCQEFHDQLVWMRANNRSGLRRLRLVGTDVPGSGGSPLPALEEVADYLRWADPDALPLAEQAAALVRRYHHPATFRVLARYATLNPATQDALTATMSRLLARMDSMAAWQVSRHRGPEHATALQHLRSAWQVDHLHRDVAGRGLPVADATRDAFMAESVLRLVENGPPDLKLVVASHNIHLQKTPITSDGAFGRFPQGYYLSQALGQDYLAIAATSIGGRTAQIQPDPEHPLGFHIRDVPLPPPAAGSVEAGFTTQAPLAIADLRAALPSIDDAQSFQRLRMEDYFTDVAVFHAFDVIAVIPQTSCTQQATADPRSPDPALEALPGAGRP